MFLTTIQATTLAGHVIRPHKQSTLIVVPVVQVVILLMEFPPIFINLFWMCEPNSCSENWTPDNPCTQKCGWFLYGSHRWKRQCWTAFLTFFKKNLPGGWTTIANKSQFWPPQKRVCPLGPAAHGFYKSWSWNLTGGYICKYLYAALNLNTPSIVLLDLNIFNQCLLLSTFLNSSQSDHQ